MAKPYFPIIPYETQNLLYPIIHEKNINAFHEYMEKYLTPENLQNYINNNEFKMTLDDAARESKKMVANIIIQQRDSVDISIINIMTEKYNFMYTEQEFKNMIRNMTIEVLLYYGTYFDLSKYYEEIKNLFAYYCLILTSDKLEKFTETGFTIEQLYDYDVKTFKQSAIYYAICSVKSGNLKYLLDKGIDFKKAETQIIVACIESLQFDNLKVLIEYGLDITAINNIKITEYEESVVKIYNLLRDYNIDPLIIALCFSKIYNEY